MIAPIQNEGTRSLLFAFIELAKPPRIRSLRQWMEEEIIIPDGPFKGQRFRCHRQPYTKLLFDEIDSGRWQRFNCVGPVQSGKTLSAFLGPMLWTLFELRETAIVGLPDINMAGDKWKVDILPVINATRYRSLLPKRGEGSKGGRMSMVQLENGAVLRFMTGGGGDKSRAGFTSRNLFVTETDGMDERGGASNEADKITQLEGRTRAYGAERRVGLECTVTTEKGRTWTEYTSGSASRIVCPCPACAHWVQPEREHLVGWQEARNELEAMELARFICPVCAAILTDENREQMNRDAVLLHGSQEVENGKVIGEMPPTVTLGFRWSAFNNLFVKAADIALDEYRAKRREDEDNAEREMLQYIWATPYQPPIWEPTPLKPEEVARRVSEYPRHMIPSGTVAITMGCDLRKTQLHYMTIAWQKNGSGFIVDHDWIPVKGDRLPVDRAVMAALKEHRKNVFALPYRVDVVSVDAGFQPDVVRAFCSEPASRGIFIPALGRGESLFKSGGRYNEPPKNSKEVRFAGEGYFLQVQRRGIGAIVDVDLWKRFVHEGLSAPQNEPGAILFYKPTEDNEHRGVSLQLTAEKETEEFTDRGTVKKWIAIRRDNHWLDCATGCSFTGHLRGVRRVTIVASTQATNEPGTVMVSGGIRNRSGNSFVSRM